MNLEINFDKWLETRESYDPVNKTAVFTAGEIASLVQNMHLLDQFFQAVTEEGKKDEALRWQEKVKKDEVFRGLDIFLMDNHRHGLIDFVRLRTEKTYGPLFPLGSGRHPEFEDLLYTGDG